MTTQVNLEVVKEIVDKSAEAILLCGEGGKILHCNDMCAQLFGYAKEELCNLSLDILLPDGKRDKHRALCENYFKQPRKMAMMAREDIHGLHKDGGTVPVKISLVPIKTYGENVTIATIHNLVTLRDVERELRQLNKDLELRVKERTEELRKLNQALQKAKEEAEEANSAKTYFLASTSHELRTPLTTILGTARHLLDHAKLDKSTEGALQTIYNSGSHLLEIISDLLDISKLETGQQPLAKEPFDVAELLMALEKSFEQKRREKNIDLHIEIDSCLPKRISTDKRLVRQVLTNLLSNALKFTASGSIRVVSSYASNNTDKINLLFKIIDTGSGVPKERIDEIFDPYVQVGDEESRQLGTGLGLYISRKYARLLGGDIQADSDVGKGSTFIFTLQAEKVEEIKIVQVQPAQKVKGLVGEASCLRVAIVEDNVVNSCILEKILGRVGVNIKSVFNGRDAIELYNSWKPHLIWMDIQMPIMDGLTATKRIRELEREWQLAPTKIVALTANAYKHDVDEALAAGCDAYATKPYDEHQLFSIMAEQLKLEYSYA